MQVQQYLMDHAQKAPDANFTSTDGGDVKAFVALNANLQLATNLLISTLPTLMDRKLYSESSFSNVDSETLANFVFTFDLTQSNQQTLLAGSMEDAENQYRLDFTYDLHFQKANELYLGYEIKQTTADDDSTTTAYCNDVWGFDNIISATNDEQRRTIAVKVNGASRLEPKQPT
jgi:hypothetical protein